MKNGVIVDGKAIAADVLTLTQQRVRVLQRPIKLTIFTCAPNFETQKFLDLKQKAAQQVGVDVTVVEWPATYTTPEAVADVMAAANETDGIIVQLPLRPVLDQDAVLAAIPASHDIDVMNYSGLDDIVLPPVTGAIAEISQFHNLSWPAALVTVVGHGRLVGQPTALWARQQGAEVTVLTKDSPDYDATIKRADIVVLGMGQPGLIKPTMIKPGAAVFDAGTSEVAGMLCGDADPDVAEVAALFTPVPGGIGPVTVAVLLRNLVTLAARQ